MENETLIVVAAVVIVTSFKVVDYFLSKAKNEDLKKTEDSIICHMQKTENGFLQHITKTHDQLQAIGERAEHNKMNIDRLAENLASISANQAVLTEILRKFQTTNDRMYDMHNKFDEDGTPLWYVPRSWATMQKEIVSTQKEISMALNSMATTLERMEKRSEKHT